VGEMGAEERKGGLGWVLFLGLLGSKLHCFSLPLKSSPTKHRKEEIGK